MLTNGKEHMIIPQHNTHKHTLRNYVDTSKGEDTKGLHPSFHWNLCSTRSMGALEKPCIEVWAPPKVFFLIPPVSLRLIPLPSSNLCRRLILCRFSSWRIWMCSSMFTPGRGGTGTAENKKKVAGTGHRRMVQKEEGEWSRTEQTHINEWWGGVIEKQRLSSAVITEGWEATTAWREEPSSKSNNVCLCNNVNTCFFG